MQIYLNYGGPTIQPYSTDKDMISDMRDACKQYYWGAHREQTFDHDGITVTVYTDGIHRSVLLTGDDNNPAVIKKLKSLLDPIGDFCDSEYKVLSNNCVTATISVLKAIDNNFIAEKTILPWMFDRELKKYCGYYDKKTTAGKFIERYQKLVHNQVGINRYNHWAKFRIEKSEDIIHHAHGKSGGTGERTKTALLELGWVTENANHRLEPTESAPQDFKTGLIAYNKDFDKVQQLKKIYMKHAGSFSLNLRSFFKDNPTYETAMARLKEQQVKNPNGASCKTLQEIATIHATEMRASLRQITEKPPAPIENNTPKFRS